MPCLRPLSAFTRARQASSSPLRGELILSSILITSVLLAGCDTKQRGPQGDEGADASADLVAASKEGEGEEGGEEEGERLTPEDLAPTFHVPGSATEIPSQLVIRSQIPLAPNTSTPLSLDDNQLLIVPEVEGTLKRYSEQALTFEARDRFEPDTTYNVRLVSLSSNEEVVTPENPWTHTFKTPPFSFVKMSAPVRTDDDELVATLYFSGQPASSDLSKFATWSISGKRPSKVTYVTGESAEIVRATIKDSVLKKDRDHELKLTLSAGVPYDSPSNKDGAIKTTTPSEVTAKVLTGQPLEILSAYPQEGSSGFYIDLICDDDADPGAKRYHWDRIRYTDHYVSPSCMPDVASAQKKIRFSPEVKNFQVASSRAGFRIFGDFEKGVYTMQIEPGLLSEKGGILRKTFKEEFTITEREPSLSFSSKGRYIPRKAWQKLSVRHLNVNHAMVTIRHIPEDNINFWLSSSSESATARVANVVARDVIALRGKEDNEEVSWIDVKKLIDAPKPGVYEVEVTTDIDEAERKKRQLPTRRPTTIARDASRILITDLNLVAKRGATKPGDPFADRMHVWAFGMEDLKPRIGVEVQAIRPSGDVLARCKTDIQGGCQLNIRTDGVDRTPPMALIATQDGDFTYIQFDQLETKHSDATTSGEPYLSTESYGAAIYGDRDLYRPADRVHLAAVLRKQDTWKAPARGVPVEVVMRDPRARVVLRKVLDTNAAGALALDYTLGDFAPTGRWNVSLNVGKKQIESYSFNVEEFVPERMKVKAKFARETFVKGDAIALDVSAKYLFGGSTEGSDVELTCSISPEPFSPTGKHKHYAYGSTRKMANLKRMELGSVKHTLDATDSASMQCPGEELLARFGAPGKLTAHLAVFEAGSGRTTSRTIQTTYLPTPAQIGLKTNLAGKVDAGKPFEVQGIVVNASGEPVSTIKKVEVELIRLVSEYGWYYDEDYGYERYRWYQREVSEGAQEVSIGSNGSFKVTLTAKEDASGFIVRAKTHGSTSESTVTDLQLDGSERYYYWYGDSSSDVTPAPEKAASVAIEAPATLEVGQVSEVSFEAPFKGRALLTVETHEVIKTEWRDVEPGKNTFSFKLKNFHPNVYVSAFIVKDPHLDSSEAFLPGRAMGVKSLKVRPTLYTQQLTIKTPKELRSESKLEVALDLGGQPTEETWLTVAVVDEGVLSLTHYKTPDLRDDLFTRRALGVTTYDTVGWGLQLESMQANAGGGDDYEEEAQMNASGEDNAGLGRPRAIKPVALWSGLVKVPASGKTSVSFDLPLYRGALRVMATTISSTKIGHAESEVLVRDPLNIQTTLPRFLTGQDEVHVPVFITNTSGSTQKVKVAFEATEQPLEKMSKAVLSNTVPLIELINPEDQTISLEDGKSGTLVFRVKALRQSGVANFKVLATAGKDLESRDEAIVPFIPAGPRERKITRHEVKDALTDLTGLLEGWEPTSEQTTFWLTTLPHGEAFAHLKFLVRYPYGCIEQTTSSTRPLLFVGDILEQVAPEVAPSKEKVTEMVDHGIRRIFSMQTSSGGFGYWPGSRYPDAWGTAYASHMLLDARQAGYDVPQERLDDALDWLEQNVDKRSYNYAEPYMHYVLALSKRGKKGRIKQLIELMPSEPSGEDAEKLYLLQAALYKLGDQRYKDDLLAPDISSLGEQRRYGYSYYSDRRRRALVLNTFYELFGQDARGEALMNLVGRSLSEKASYWYTTQELVWGVTALGKWAKGGAKDVGDAKLLVNNSPLAAVQKSEAGGPGTTWNLMRASEFDAVQLQLDKAPQGKLYLVVNSEGVRKNPELTYGGAGISLTRSYLDANGKSISLANVELGQVIYSQLRITNQTSSTIENVAVVERFPAGWEVENPTLNGQSVPDALIQDAWGHQHMNVRDDRVEAFNTLRANQSATITIALRATSAGVFKAPSAHAEAMYDPSKWARVRPVDLKVLGPWED